MFFESVSRLRFLPGGGTVKEKTVLLRQGGIRIRFFFLKARKACPNRGTFDRVCRGALHH